MVGLLTKNENILRQWQKLANRNKNRDSTQLDKSLMEALCLGLPTSQQEMWRHTPLDRILDHNFTAPLPLELSAHFIRERALKIDAILLVFVDGCFSYTLSDNKYDPFSISIIPHGSEPIVFNAPIHPDIFMHLTESLVGQTTFIHLSSGQKVQRPLYLLHITSGSSFDELYTSGYRHHLQQDDFSQVTVIEHYITLNNLPHFTTARFTANISNNATFKHYYLAFEDPSSYHLSHNDLILGENVRVESHSFLLGAGVTLHQTSSQFQGEGSNLIVNSLMFPIKKEICENRTWLEHVEGASKSHQLHKTIVCDDSRAIFNGMIKVFKNASQTYGQMNNRNLLLGCFGEVYTQPQLEVYNDDVKCGHGATIESLNAEQMFYLQSRGVNKNIAQRIIINAFFSELTEFIPDVILKNAIMQHINNRF
ncbi:FeS cluster assembly protein SufD [Candidatus Erwinia haradaeae]|uniref:FeS cluster assembly protein SufD n=2 Tax=Candidatus Erwinia haradaeae TaxID=1922217 RepID=A0A451D339_9GAMM|nr:FeS cluster assembly protein SufD [Candidatus Erwinia haradaeae]